jgi:Domain of unknown function (DUF397)
MKGTDLPDGLWFKSSYSNDTANCLEVALPGSGRVAARDSKDPAGPALTFTAEAWGAFVGSVRDGEFPQR